MERGSMIILPESNRIDRATRLKALYQNPESVLSGDGTTDGWLARDPNDLAHLFDNGDQFASTDFEEGDVVILKLDTLHMTARNVTDKWRISCDTRWIAL